MLNEYLWYRGIYADVVGGEMWTGWFLSSLLVLRFFDFQNHLLEKKKWFISKNIKKKRDLGTLYVTLPNVNFSS